MMTDHGPERKRGLDANRGVEANRGPDANRGLETNRGPEWSGGLEADYGADHGPEHNNGHRRHGLEKHEVPPPGAVPMGDVTDRTTTPDGPSFPVLPTSEHDKLNQRLRYAVSSFVDAPRGSVEEADALLEEMSARLVDLLAERRRTLRAAWHEGAAGTAETEELRLAMRGYRNVLERLLAV
ncbi:hypothetical protein [Streptomyces sp. NPDC021212]|uniref:hypothetical protein n=1 Tax=Streptomyces sp. NPDC021212 TaxID=3365118 RepID=UPI00378795DE